MVFGEATWCWMDGWKGVSSLEKWVVMTWTVLLYRHCDEFFFFLGKLYQVRINLFKSTLKRSWFQTLVYLQFEKRQ